MFSVVWTTEIFFRYGLDMQVFQIWKTSGTTYLLVVWTTYLLVFWTSWKSSGLPVSRLQVIWTSWKFSEAVFFHIK
ncbi:hypothetical protein Bca101_025149 [Brassica carinata]